MLFGCVFFKGLFLRCHSLKMPKGIFSFKNHLWVKPKCGVMDLERTFWVVTSGWKQTLGMEIVFFLLLRISPIVNFLLPPLNSGSRWAYFSALRAQWVSLFCCPLKFVCCHLSLQILKLSTGEQGWVAGSQEEHSDEERTEDSEVWQTWVEACQLLAMWQPWVHSLQFIETQSLHL